MMGFAQRRKEPPRLIGSDNDGFGLGVVIQRFSAVFFAKPALLQAAKRKLVVDDLRRVYPRVPRVNSLSRASRSIQVIRPNRRTKAEDRVVGLFNCFVEAADSENRQCRAEDLFTSHPRVFGHISQQRWRVEVPSIVVAASQAIAAS